MRRTVFISHSSADADAAWQICDYLEGQGVPCWIAPRDVTPGQEYAAEIIEGLLECPVLVLVLSENANSSIYVKREVERAVSAGKLVFPVRIREVAPSRSLELFVASSHWIDAWQPPLHQHLDRLIDSIKSAVGPIDGATERKRTDERPRAQVSQRPSSSGVRRKRAGTVAVVVMFGLVFATVGAGWWLFEKGGFEPEGSKKTAVGASTPNQAGTPSTVAISPNGPALPPKRIPAGNAPRSPAADTSSQEALSSPATAAEADMERAVKGHAPGKAVREILTLLDGSSGTERYRSIHSFSAKIPAHLTVPDLLAIIGNSANRTSLLSAYVERLPRTLSMEDSLAILGTAFGSERYRTINAIERRLPETLTAQQVLTIIGDSANRQSVLASLAGRLPKTLSFEETLAILTPTSGAERYRTIGTIEKSLPGELTTEQALTIVGDSANRLNLLSVLVRRLPATLSMEEALAIIGTASGADRYRTINVIASRVEPGLKVEDVLKIVGNSSNRDKAISLLQQQGAK
jgi:hypothetical protein